MKKSRSRAALEDRLSELPDSLILHILELLPTVDVVRTTILSNRWRNLWTTVRSLTFDSSRFDNAERVIGFGNGVVRFWRGNKIIRFCVNLDVKEAVFSDIDSWVSFAVENEVEMLDLHLEYPDRVGGEEEYCLPQFLYSCSLLKRLSVRGCVLETNGEVQWNRLESLEIDDGCYIEKDVLNRILLGSPLLELLVLFVGENYGNFSICSSSLKELRIQKEAFDYPDVESELRICTPNLEKLGMWGIPYGRNLLQNVSSLTLATLEFDSPAFPNEYDSPTWILLVEVLRDIYSAIQHVEKVELSDWCIQVLGDAAGKSLLPPCPNVKTLKLKGCLEEYKQILGLVEAFPKLTRLVLVPKEEFRPVREQNAEGFSELKFQTNSFLSELRTVKVWCTKVDTSFYPLMELVMKYASQLEKVVFFKWFSLKLFHKEVSSFCIKGTGDASFDPLMELVMKHVSQLGTVVFHKQLSPKTSDKEVSSFCIEGTCAASFYPLMELVMKYSSQLDKVVIRKWLKP